MVLADERHDQEVKQPDRRYERLHHAEGEAEQDGHGVVWHLRTEAHVLVLPQPLARAGGGREARLDIVEQEADEAEEADGLARKGLQINMDRQVYSLVVQDPQLCMQLCRIIQRSNLLHERAAWGTSRDPSSAREGK